MVLNVVNIDWMSISKRRQPVVRDPRLPLKVPLKLLTGLLSVAVLLAASLSVVATTFTSGAILHTYFINE